VVRSALLFTISFSLLAACGGEERDAEGLPSEVLPEVTPPPTSTAPLSPLDEEGNLRGSGEHVAGLELPMALTASVAEERRHTYLTSIALAPVLRYFGPRLTTGQVEPLPGGGASYRAATPRDAHGATVPLDVTIRPVPGQQVMVEIVEIPPEPITPPPELESIRALERTLETSE